jgi:Tfp pilus assembly protein PilO
MIKKDIFSKKVQDYTFSVLFFLIFSFSIFFIIRPTLKTLFSLKKQAKDLEEVDQFYDQKIVMIAQVQQFLENNREKLPLLKEAIPDKPNLAKVVDDLNKVSSESGFLFKKINMGETSLKEAKEKKYNQLVLNIEGEADFSTISNFLEELLKQRRLKMVEKLIITQNKESSPSGLLKVEMEINASYL